LLVRILCLLAAVLVGGCQSASDRPSLSSATPPPYEAIAWGGDARYASLVIDAESGETLHAINADAQRYPASLTKMMTLYILFEELERGRFSLTSPLIVSTNAARQPPSKLGVRAGSTISVEDAILGLAVKSGNDVAVAVAENVSGSEAAFVGRMNSTASALGMRRTTFRNPNGLPDPAQTTTARDMAVLARALQTHFASRYPVFSTQAFAYAGKRYESTNELLGEVPGVDGIKTGYTRASGFCLAASVRRDGRRLIVIVMGAPSNAARNAHVTALIDEYLPERRGLAALF
jgi:D-alanyl-D-alanine carboxypeptidase